MFKSFGLIQQDIHQKDYLIDIMGALAKAMVSKKHFVVSIITGTNTLYLKTLKKTSNYPVVHVSLAPLVGKEVEIFHSAVYNILYKRWHLSECTKALLEDASGNPQLLKLLLLAMSTVGNGINYTKTPTTLDSNNINSLQVAKSVSLKYNSDSFANFMGIQTY
jgi:hypothetical protein